MTNTNSSGFKEGQVHGFQLENEYRLSGISFLMLCEDPADYKLTSIKKYFIIEKSLASL